MIVTMLAGPAAEPVGLADATDYLRIAGDGEDGLVASQIAGARERIERLAEVAMISQTLRVTMNGWPRGAVERRIVVLPVRPADELVAVRVFDAQGESQDVTARLALPRCRAGGRAVRLVWVDGAFPWPGQTVNGIEIDYVAGFGEEPDDVAERLRQTVKRPAGHAYHARDVETLAGPLPDDVKELASPWRRVRL